MFAGRVVLGSLAERVGAWPVLGGAAVGLIGAGLLAWLGGPAGAMAAVLLFGLAAAPVYPLLILTTAERTSATECGRGRRLPGGRLLRRSGGVPAADRTGDGPLGRRARLAASQS